jgi:hypothetical protein
MNETGARFAALTFFALTSSPAFAQVFNQTCANPSFPAKAANAIDSSCATVGSGKKAEAAQNTQKNDFCASGNPAPMTFEKLNGLQTQVETTNSINFGDSDTATRKAGPTTNRAPLTKMGEGNLVVLNGFVLIARQEGAESVNCGKTIADDPLNHDIHISLVATADQRDECNSVVVEMSPHHRPSDWTADNVNLLAKTGTPVRATGHLFFDSSHVPCANDHEVGHNPSRSSLWEVHPIYKFEVCTANCDGASTWVDLATWVKNRPAKGQ